MKWNWKTFKCQLSKRRHYSAQGLEISENRHLPCITKFIGIHEENLIFSRNIKIFTCPAAWDTRKYERTSTIFEPCAHATNPNKNCVIQNFTLQIKTKVFYQILISQDFSISVLGKPLSENDIHLIMEYGAGSQWGNYTANRANRFVWGFHHRSLALFFFYILSPQMILTEAFNIIPFCVLFFFYVLSPQMILTEAFNIIPFCVVFFYIY